MSRPAEATADRRAVPPRRPPPDREAADQEPLASAGRRRRGDRRGRRGGGGGRRPGGLERHRGPPLAHPARPRDRVGLVPLLQDVGTDLRATVGRRPVDPRDHREAERAAQAGAGEQRRRPGLVERPALRRRRRRQPVRRLDPGARLQGVPRAERVARDQAPDPHHAVELGGERGRDRLPEALYPAERAVGGGLERRRVQHRGADHRLLERRGDLGRADRRTAAPRGGRGLRIPRRSATAR